MQVAEKAYARVWRMCWRH